MTNHKITRRAVLEFALATPLLALASEACPAQDKKAASLNLPTLKKAPGIIVPLDEQASVRQVALTRQWNGALCRARLSNRGSAAVRIKEVVLFDLTLALPPATRLYGEGFQMLTQTAGTRGKPVDEGNYTISELPPRSARLLVCR